MAVTIAGGSSTAGRANVTSTFDLQVRTPTVEENAGFATMSSEIDDGTVTGSRLVKSPEATHDYRLRVGVDCPMFNHSFEGTIVATDRLNQSLSTMTVAQASGFLSLNSGNATASGNYAIVTTRRTFPILGTYQLYANMFIREANETATNAVSEWGLGYAATTAAPTDGAFFRRESGGQLVAVVNFAGSESGTTANITTTNVPPGDGTGSYNPTESNHYLIAAGSDSVNFWINDTLVATIPTQGTRGIPVSSSEQQLFARVYNSGVASAGRRVELGFITVEMGDTNSGKPWPHVVAGMGGSAYSVQPGTATGPTVTRTNGAHGWPASATARIAGTWTATSAPALNSLGGLWTSPAISSLTSDADYPVFAYLNPAGTNAIPGKTLHVTGIRCGEAYAAAAASTNAIFLSCIVSAGATAAATSTGDAATTVGLRGVVVGGYGFVATDVIGSVRPGFDVTFTTPLVVPPGCYFHFIVRPVGTVTSNTLVVHSSLMVNGYFE
jgi:hypothetical protein